MALSDTLHTLRLRNFFTRTFAPRYQSFQRAASQTRLVIMLWAPHSTDEWSIFCKQVFNELERLGHTIHYSEHLGVSSAMRLKKGVEYKATDTLDLILVAQPNYALVGDVRDLTEFLVVDAKMLLFIDQAAPDRHLYEHALSELATFYNNIDSFQYPGDLTQGTLLKKILVKVGMMQTVKNRAIHREKNWGLTLSADMTHSGPNAAPVSLPYNLLELYRLNRDELETWLDSTTLFILAYVNHIGTMTMRALWHDMKLDAAQMEPRMMRLQHGKMLAETNGNVTITEFGKQILRDLNL